MGVMVTGTGVPVIELVEYIRGNRRALVCQRWGMLKEINWRLMSCIRNGFARFYLRSLFAFSTSTFSSSGVYSRRTRRPFHGQGREHDV
jgi:hypothetical protein